MASQERICGCTIIAANYLAQARVLATSFHRQHPDASFYVLLADDAPDVQEKSDDVFTIVRLADLGITELRDMCFQYNLKELNTAVKPALLRYLFTEEKQNKVLFLDPDILVTDALQPLFDELNTASIILTPHVCSPIPRGVLPSDADVLKVGIYNLGFIGLKNTPEAMDFLLWWHDRLTDGCTEDVLHGLFVDQRWADLATGFADAVKIIRDPAYNVAYWNLHERTLSRDGGRYLVNGLPLRFYHFSGFLPHRPKELTKYVTTHRLADNPVLGELHSDYAKLAREAGYDLCSAHPYAFATFDNGVKIPDAARRVWRELKTKRARFGDPFTTTAGSFFLWLQKPAVLLGHGRFLTNLHRAIHIQQKELHTALESLDEAASACTFAAYLSRHRPTLDPVFLTSLKLFSRVPHFDDVGAMLGRYIVRLRHFSSHQWRRFRLHAFRFRLHLSHALSFLRGTDRAPANKNGVTVAGYVTTESGMGEAVRRTILSLDAANIPSALNDAGSTLSRSGEMRFRERITSASPYAVNILHINADQVSDFVQRHGQNNFAGKKNIAYWTWELERFPEQWNDAAAHFDEIWAPSDFARDSIARTVSVPVFTIPHALDVNLVSESPSHGRGHFGPPEDAFLFVFLFDFLSIFERKNPLGLIRAFRGAFLSGEPAALAIKCINGRHDPENFGRLLAAAEADPRITILHGYQSSEETRDLMRCCDAYVSLHRSEGFGLTLSEAMALGKPVIATDYSGNTDFMTADVSYPVGYRLTELTETHGPYEKGNVWAEPDISDAARLMRFVFEHPLEAQEKGQRGAKFVRDLLSPERIGHLMRERLYEGTRPAFLRRSESVRGSVPPPALRAPSPRV